MNVSVGDLKSALHQASNSPFLQRASHPQRAVRLALTGLLGLVAAMALATLAVFASGFLEAGVGPALKTDPLLSGLLEDMTASLVIAALGAGFWLAASLVQRRHPRTFVTGAPRFRWALLAAGFLMVAPVATAIILIEPGTQRPTLLRSEPALSRTVYALGVLAITLAVSFGEEVFFRGWLMQQTAAFTARLWLVMGVSAIAFTAFHLSSDPFILAVRLLSGLVLAWTVLRLGGLEFAVGAHAARNAMIGWWENEPSGEVTAGAVIGHVAITIAILAAAEVVVRRRASASSGTTAT